MDVARFCNVQVPVEQTTHQRIAEYVKQRCDQYAGMGFTPREEWLIEQTIDGLHQLLADIRCSEVGRMAVSAFLDIAAEELPGSP